MNQRSFKGDRWTRLLGSRIPVGAVVRVVRFCPRRRVLVEYEGERMLTPLWCLEKLTAAPRATPDEALGSIGLTDVVVARAVPGMAGPEKEAQR